MPSLNLLIKLKINLHLHLLLLITHMCNARYVKILAIVKLIIVLDTHKTIAIPLNYNNTHKKRSGSNSDNLVHIIQVQDAFTFNAQVDSNVVVFPHDQSFSP